MELLRPGRTWTPVSILQCQWHGHGIIGLCNQAQTRTEIESLRGSEILVEKRWLVSLPDQGVIYWNHLIGRKVQTCDRQDLGICENIYNAGASDIMEIVAGNCRLEIPLVPDFIDLTQLDMRADQEIVLVASYSQIEPLVSIDAGTQMGSSPRSLDKYSNDCPSRLEAHQP